MSVFVGIERAFYVHKAVIQDGYKIMRYFLLEAYCIDTEIHVLPSINSIPSVSKKWRAVWGAGLWVREELIRSSISFVYKGANHLEIKFWYVKLLKNNKKWKMEEVLHELAHTHPSIKQQKLLLVSLLLFES